MAIDADRAEFKGVFVASGYYQKKHHVLSKVRIVMIDFIIIGTQRGGTRSFYNYLLQHPLVVPSFRTDLNFFDRNYSKGIEWYARQFPLLSQYEASNRPDGHITGEASPYYMYHPLVAERIKRHCPKTKLIVLLRNPTDRAYSHFRHAVELGQETLSFADALRLEAKRLERDRYCLKDNPFHLAESDQNYSYLSNGFYAQQLRNWFKHFNQDQFLFIRSEDYFEDPVSETAKAFKFLGISDIRPKRVERTRMNPFGILTAETRMIVDRIYHEPNHDLCQVLGWAHAW